MNYLRTENIKFESEELKYPGSVIINNNNMREEIIGRMTVRERCYFTLTTPWF